MGSVAVDTVSDERQWGLPISHIQYRPLRPDQIRYHNLHIPEFASALDLVLDPAPVQHPPPGKFTYPSGRSFHMRPDDRYRCGYCYHTCYDVPSDKKSELDYLTRIITPPGTAPVGYDPMTRRYLTRPIEGMVQLTPGVPFCINLDRKPEDSVSVATLIDDTVLEDYTQIYPEAQEALSTLDELQKVTWAEYMEGEERLPAIYELEGLKANMQSKPPSPEKPNCSSSHASSLLEGNGKGWGVPTSQVNSPLAIQVRMRILQLLSQLYWLVAPFALSLSKFDITTFRSLDLNVFSFGGILPTGLTGMQTNLSTATKGGNLRDFIGFLQGSWHIDVKDDPCRWTMLVIQLRLPPEVGPLGRVQIILFFKGNDLHTGIVPTVDESHWTEFLRKLAGKVNQVNRVVYVCYPTKVLTHHTVPMAKLSTHGLSPITSKESTGLNYASHGVPALGDESSKNLRLYADLCMTNWNDTLQLGDPTLFPMPMGPTPPPSQTPQLLPYPTFKPDPNTFSYVPMDPICHASYFAEQNSEWR
ncbi:hypothetical protein PM082_010139 [Marasmius tenuissimus]|nr:hypothetical protein PM082_010139 [Marasmius tenuissimus]